MLEIDRHAGQLEKFDVEGILAFAERVLPRAADLWVQASLEQRQRLQQLFFPAGVAFDAKRFVGAGLSTHAFKYLTPDLPAGNNLASRNFPIRTPYPAATATKDTGLCPNRGNYAAPAAKISHENFKTRGEQTSSGSEHIFSRRHGPRDVIPKHFFFRGSCLSPKCQTMNLIRCSPRATRE